MNEPLVDVVMVTYNQEKYIAQAIESVLMQKTNFPFRLIIGEDCSTDDTRSICINYTEKHPEQIKLILHDKNQGLLKNYKSVFDACTAKYLAILEGDDYWIDEFKLQKQVNTLEKNDEVGLVHTDCDLIFESGKIQKGSHQKHEKVISNGFIFNQLIIDNYIRPATVMLRKKLYNNYVNINEYLNNNFKTLDYPFWLDIAPHCKFHYLNYSTAHYRIHNNSISHSNQYQKTVEFHISTYNIKQYAIKKNNYSKYLLKLAKQKYLKDRLTLEMSFLNYSNIQQLRKELKNSDLKSFVIKILTAHHALIRAYCFINNLRQKRIKGIINIA